jgi:glucokinase
MPDLLLAGDVGGTNTRLRLVDAATDVVQREQTYGGGQPVAEALATFFGTFDGRVAAAALGVAGRVVDHDVRMTNRPGESITNEAVAAALKIEPTKVRLVNDMVAHQAGLAASDVITLREGTAEGDVEGLVMPGTGLGTGFRVRVADGWQSFPSEGGHLDFGPPNASLDFVRDVALDLLEVPLDGRLSWEDVASGPALPLLYAAVTNRDRPHEIHRPQPTEVTASAVGDEIDGVDNSAAREAVRLFLALVGARAGNLLLDVLATHRMTFGGGILVGLHDRDPDLVTSCLFPAFNACGPEALHATLEKTPLALLRSPDSGLLGATALAREAAAA